MTTKRGGRKSEPTAILQLAGSKHEKYVLQKKRKREPKPKPVAPRMPTKLSDGGKRYWKWLVPKLEEIGVISQDNREVLKRYCGLMAMWDDLYDDVKANGVSQTTMQGTSSQRAEYRSMMQIGEECRRLEVEFGLTPSSRGGIQVINAVEKQPDDPKKAYFA